MSNTGHDDFDRWKDEFSDTVRDIEATMHRKRTSSNNNNAAELIRKAYSILAKLSSATKNVSETEEPALKQELVDIYEACKMQIKTYKTLNEQKELFRNNTTSTSTSPGTSTSATTSSSSLLCATGTSGGDSSRYNSTTSNNNSFRDHITAKTQGRVRKQNSQLQDALRSIKESEQVAQEISGELQGQRETLETAQGRLGQFSSMTEYSKGILKTLNKPWWRKW